MRTARTIVSICLMIAPALFALPSWALASDSPTEAQTEGITVLVTDSGLLERTQSGNKSWGQAPFEVPPVKLTRPVDRTTADSSSSALNLTHRSQAKGVGTTVYATDNGLMVLSYSGFRHWRPTTKQVIKSSARGPSLFSVRRPATQSRIRSAYARRGPAPAVTSSMSTMLRGAGY